MTKRKINVGWGSVGGCRIKWEYDNTIVLFEADSVMRY